MGEKQGAARSARNVSGANLYENNFDISADISQQIFFAKSSPTSNDPIFAKISSSIIYIGIGGKFFQNYSKIFHIFTKFLLFLYKIFPKSH